MQYKKRLKTRELTEKFYNWDLIASKWENYLDELDNSGYRAKWDEYKTLTPVKTQQKDKDNIDSLILLCRDNLQDIDRAATSKMLTFLNDADYGFQIHGLQTVDFNMDKVAKQIEIYINNNNQLCEALDNKISLNDDFIQYAKLKAGK